MILMAGRMRLHRARAPKQRVSPSQPGYFYPGEVVRLLSLGDIDYAQLRELLALVRGWNPEAHRWARYDLHDIACIQAAIELAGGVQALAKGRKLRLEPLRRALAALRTAGISDPVLRAGLLRQEGRVLASSAGVTFDVTTGQLLLEFAEEVAVGYLKDNVVTADFAAMQKTLSAERRLIRREPRRNAVRRRWPVDVAAERLG